MARFVKTQRLRSPIELMVLRAGERINLVLESSSYIDDEGQKKEESVY